MARKFICETLTKCPHCGGRRSLFRHFETWRIFCSWCHTFWRFKKDPRRTGQPMRPFCSKTDLSQSSGVVDHEKILKQADLNLPLK